MTPRRHPRRPARRPAAAASAVVAALALTGCEAPTPIVTMQSGTSVVTSEARVWCFGGFGQECRDEQQARPAVRLEASPGQLLSFDVSKEVAERGWFVDVQVAGVEGQDGAYPARDDHYFTLTMPPATVTFNVRALDGGAEDPDELDRDRQTGLWTFVVTPKD
jgi:hypothetical protein